MTEQDLIKLIQDNHSRETEILEFKEAKNQYSVLWWEKKDKNSIYAYCVGIGNMGWWKLLLWVKNDGTINWTSLELPLDIKTKIYQLTQQHIEINEIQTEIGKVIIISIPSRRTGQYFEFYGVPLMRKDDGLIPMDQQTIKKILNETNKDRSSQACEWTTIDDLDPRAIELLRNKKSEISKDPSYLTCDTTTFLNQLSLLTEYGVPNNTCILFLGKQNIAERKLPAISRFAWLYVDEKNGIEDRLTAEQQRSPLIITIYLIISKIQKYNLPLEDITLFRPDPEPQYDEKAIEELLANSLAHRDRSIELHNEVRQIPRSLTVTNPWIFDNDLEKVLRYSHSTPYKNQTMADFLSKINLMENERRWLQKVYKLQLSKWVSVEKTDIDNNHGWLVQFTLHGKIKHIEFAKIVLQRKNIELSDLILLDHIADGRDIIWQHISPENAAHLKQLWFVEFHGKTPNRKVWLSYNLLDELDQPEKYIIDKWVKKQELKLLIIQLLEKKWTVELAMMYRLCVWKKEWYVRALLSEMQNKDNTITRVWTWLYQKK